MGWPGITIFFRVNNLLAGHNIHYFMLSKTGITCNSQKKKMVDGTPPLATSVEGEWAMVGRKSTGGRRSRGREADYPWCQELEKKKTCNTEKCFTNRKTTAR